MVVICLPSAAETGSTQERTALPSMCTVQAPHIAMPHPYLVPVRPACSRIAHKSGVLGLTLTSSDLPLMLKRAMVSPSPDCGAVNIRDPVCEGKLLEARAPRRRAGLASGYFTSSTSPGLQLPSK